MERAGHVHLGDGGGMKGAYGLRPSSRDLLCVVLGNYYDGVSSCNSPVFPLPIIL